jgi:hypothetical protein
MSTDVERKISCSVLRIASKEAEKLQNFWIIRRTEGHNKKFGGYFNKLLGKNKYPNFS